MPTDPAELPRKRRRGRKRLLSALLFLLVLAFLPEFVRTPPVRRYLLTRINQALTPGRLEVRAFRASWLGATRLHDVTLADGRGHQVAQVARAVWDRNIFQIIFDRPHLGTLTLEEAQIHVTRRVDGTFDLVEALGAILSGEDDTDLTVKIPQGSLQVAAPGLSEPIHAKSFDLTLQRPPRPAPVAWTAALANGRDQSLNLTGTFAAEPKAFEVTMTAQSWPLAIIAHEIDARTRIQGRFAARLDAEGWSTSGSLDLDELELSGPPLGGDRPQLSPVQTRWAASGSQDQLHDLQWDLDSPIGSIRTPKPDQILATFDLPQVLRLLPKTLPARSDATLDRGTLTLAVNGLFPPQSPTTTVRASLPDLAGRIGANSIALKQPIALTATLRGATLDALVVESAFLNLHAKGSLDEGVVIQGDINSIAFRDEFSAFFPTNFPEIATKGVIAATVRRDGTRYPVDATWSTLQLQVGAGPTPTTLGEMRLHVATQRIAGVSWDRWPWQGDVTVASTQGAGLDLGPTRVAATLDGRNVDIEPIETTLNGGRMSLKPEVLATPDGWLLRLAAGSELVGAEINPTSASRVLSYVAPVLAGATRASGKVSASIDRAEIPLGEGARDRAILAGEIVFRDVQFAPGPLASSLVELTGRQVGTLTLDEPVVLSIAGGKIHQEGLALPLGEVAEIEVEGDVGFDRSLALRATLPLTKEMFPRTEILGAVLSGTRLTVPITGTLQEPRIDRDAFRQGLAEQGRNLLGQGALQGVSALLDRLNRPRDPNAPPPLTPQERRASRQQRRAERRANRPE